MARKFYIENNEAIPSIAFELVAPVGFSEITDSIKLKDLYLKKYNERTRDGKDYYNNFRTNLYIEIINGVIIDSEAFALEQHIKELSNNLLTGNWLTAQNTNTNLILSGVYTQVMKSKLDTDINNYLSDNY